MALTTFVINLDNDKDRLVQVYADLSSVAELDVRRIDAINGALLPQSARHVLTQSERWSEGGTLGCFLSHAKAWEATSYSTTPCLILEDDAILHGLERIHDLQLPDDFDLVFVNDRVCTEIGPIDKSPNCIHISNGIKKLNITGLGVGADGYLLTPLGARKLLSALKKDLFFGHVDWRVLRYSVNPSDLNGDLAQTRCDNILRFHHHGVLKPDWGILNSYCLDVALILLRGNQRSSRLENNANGS